jgi:hypothetical protein
MHVYVMADHCVAHCQQLVGSSVEVEILVEVQGQPGQANEIVAVKGEGHVILESRTYTRWSETGLTLL